MCDVVQAVKTFIYTVILGNIDRSLAVKRINIRKTLRVAALVGATFSGATALADPSQDG